LRGGQNIVISDADAKGLLVKADVAYKQMNSESKVPPPIEPPARPVPEKPESPTPEPPKTLAKRFHGTVTLDTTRVGRDASRIAEEMISHLSGLVGAKVTVTLDIDVDIPSGVPDNVVRIVTENSRTLKFATHGFEKE